MSRILLADDSPHAQRMGERILKEEGFEVISVTDGDTASKRLADVDPDLIIADVFLPGVNGFELCRKVKAAAAHRHVRVVMTAGMLEVFDEEEARRAGADAILKKPFEASAMVDTIKPLAAAAREERNAPAVAAPVVVTAMAQAVAAPPAPAYTPAAEPVFVVEVEPIDFDEPEPEPAPPVSAAVSIPVPVPPEVTVVQEEPAPAGELDPELVRAAVTVAMDEALPALIDEITERVMAALRNNR